MAPPIRLRQAHAPVPDPRPPVVTAGTPGTDSTGSPHRPDQRTAALMEKQLERHRIVVPAFQRGQVSFHDWRTVHGSAPNRSDRPRRSMAVHLQAGTNHWREWRHPDGRLRIHANDRLVCRDAADRPDYSDPERCPVLWPLR